MISKLLVAAILLLPAQRGQRGPAGPPPTPKAVAPVDLTGYWVSVVTEDWRWRMVTPPKGDVNSIPVNPEGRRVAGTWDPAADEAAGNPCKAYGAAGIIRIPGQLHITWADDNTLKVDTEAGTQTRMFRFGNAPPPAEASWQGHSVAQWERAGLRGGNTPGGNLKVVTTRMKPGYLRKNGVPYSENAVLTEYYHRMIEPGGTPWIVVITTVEDPTYLAQPYVVTTQFKKVPDASAAWTPTPCSSR
ncbi:MAG: hypothetical protein EXQ52_00200 [Bryobacterales bacterium]|nr:hypothetical protein [Bryobacterales bacterium]